MGNNVNQLRATHQRKKGLSSVFGFFSRPSAPASPPLDSLYRAIIASARQPFWYLECGIPDDVGGRLGMVSLVTGLVLVRLEKDGAPEHPAQLVERFVDDMDGSLRRMGVGDMKMGREVGRAVGILEKRLAACREAVRAGDMASLAALVTRDTPVTPEQRDRMVQAATRLSSYIGACALDQLLNGDVDLCLN